MRKRKKIVGLSVECKEEILAHKEKLEGNRCFNTGVAFNTLRGSLLIEWFTY